MNFVEAKSKGRSHKNSNRILKPGSWVTAPEGRSRLTELAPSWREWNRNTYKSLVCKTGLSNSWSRTSCYVWILTALFTWTIQEAILRELIFTTSGWINKKELINMSCNWTDYSISLKISIIHVLPRLSMNTIFPNSSWRRNYLYPACPSLTTTQKTFILGKLLSVRLCSKCVSLLQKKLTYWLNGWNQSPVNLLSERRHLMPPAPWVDWGKYGIGWKKDHVPTQIFRISVNKTSVDKVKSFDKKKLWKNLMNPVKRLGILGTS